MCLRIHPRQDELGASAGGRGGCCGHDWFQCVAFLFMPLLTALRLCSVKVSSGLILDAAH